eukprot:jgi/Psemu1/61135/gm1.61135_g
MQPTTFDLDLWQAGGVTSFSQTPFAEYWSTLPSIVDTETTAESNGVHSSSSNNNKNKNNIIHETALRWWTRTTFGTARHWKSSLIENTGGEP